MENGGENPLRINWSNKGEIDKNCNGMFKSDLSRVGSFQLTIYLFVQSMEQNEVTAKETWVFDREWNSRSLKSLFAFECLVCFTCFLIVLIVLTLGQSWPILGQSWLILGLCFANARPTICQYLANTGPILCQEKMFWIVLIQN